MTYRASDKQVSNLCSDTNLSSRRYVLFVAAAANEHWRRVACAVPDKCLTSCIFCICYPGNTNTVVFL